MNTSKKAYKEIKEDGSLANMEQLALDLIKLYGPLNGRMLDKYMPGGHKRIKALLDRGCIGEAYFANDKVTGKLTAYYMWLSDKPLHKPVSVKKPKYNNDPKALAHLYDKSFESGVRAAMAWVYAGGEAKVIEDMVQEILEAQR